MKFVSYNGKFGLSVFFSLLAVCWLGWPSRALAGGDLNNDWTSMSDVFMEDLKPSAFYEDEAQFLLDLGLNFNLAFLDGRFTEKQLDALFRLVERYPNRDSVTSLLAMAATASPQSYGRVMPFLLNLAEKYPSSRELNLTAAELLLAKGKMDDAFLCLKRAYDAVRADLTPVGKRRRIYNAAIASKLLLLYSERSAKAKNDLELRKSERNFRHELERIPAFRSSPPVQEALFVSCIRELERDPSPAVPQFIIPVKSDFVGLEEELDSIVRTMLSDILCRSDKDPVEEMALPSVFRIIHELGRDHELLQASLIRLAENPDDTEAALIVALMNAEKEDYPLEAGAWDMVFERIKHPNPQMLSAYASALSAAKRYAEAERFYRLAGADVSDGGTAFSLQIAVSYFDQGRFRDALALLDLAEESFERSVLRAECLIHIGDHLRAYQALKDAARRKPAASRDLNFCMMMASAAEKIGDMESLEKSLKPFLSNRVVDPEVYNMLGYSFADHDYKLDDAEKYLDKARQLMPESAAIADSCAWLYYRKKDYAKAKNMMQRAFRLYGSSEMDDPVMLDHAGDIEYALGNTAEAKKYWQRALLLVGDVDYDGLEWKIDGGTPERWMNYRRMKQPVSKQSSDDSPAKP